MNYIRNVKFQIKPGKTEDFNRLFANDVMPILKRQAGFKHELSMVNGNAGIGLSVWQDKASAERYQTTGYPEVLNKLNPVLDGAPHIENFDLTLSTLTV